MYKCKFCEKSFERFESLGGHVVWCNFNPKVEQQRQQASIKKQKQRINVKIICEKCGKEFEQEIIDSDFGRRCLKRFCSKKCANGHEHTEEWKRNISTGIKNSSKFINCFNSGGHNKTNVKYIECSICHKIMVVKNWINKKTCSDKCYRKLLSLNAKKQGFGGYTPGSIGCNKYRKNCGWYKGYWCDSSWELAFVIYNLEHGIKFERNLDRFYYKTKGKIHYYVPDFKKETEYIEIKGYEDESDFIKYKSVCGKLTLLKEKDMKLYLSYVINKYGKEFILLYDKS
jgi:hypothetical protein